ASRAAARARADPRVLAQPGASPGRRGVLGEGALTHASSAAVELLLAEIRAIPEGFVRTYGDLSPGSPRLTGWVLKGTTEDVPWWRVVRADGSLPVGEKQRA